jgi:AcrR family transcriptional regulator
MPRRKEQFEQMREQSRSVILQAALKLFAKKGFDGASMAMIAREAGISAGLTYNYFKSKDEILTVLFSQAIDNLNNAIGAHDGEVSRGDCRMLMENLAASAEEEKNLWRLMTQIMLQPDVARRLISGLKAMPGNPKSVFKRYFSGKNVSKADEKAGALTALVIGTVLFHLTHDDDTTMRRAFELIDERLL